MYRLGPRTGFTYELRRLPNGQVYIRYEVEIYHPEEGRAEEHVRGGDVVPVR